MALVSFSYLSSQNPTRKNVPFALYSPITSRIPCVLSAPHAASNVSAITFLSVSTPYTGSFLVVLQKYTPALFVTPTDAVSTANAISNDTAPIMLAFFTVKNIDYPDYIRGKSAKLKKLCHEKSIFLLFRLIPSLTPSISVFFRGDF